MSKEENYITIQMKQNNNNEENISTETIIEKLNRINRFSNTLEPLIKSLAELQKSMIPTILSQNENLFNTINSVTKGIVNSFDFNQLVNITLSSKFNKIFETLSNTLSTLNLGDLSGYETEYLKKRFWVIPFEYEYKDINNLTCLTKKEFETEMIKYFNNARVKRLFSYCINEETKSDRKRLLRQVRDNYFLGNYSICITSLITYLDNITLKFIDNNSPKQHTSYKVVDSLHEYYLTHDTYQMFLKIEVLKNFYDILYQNNEELKTPKTNIINRNLISHGSKYSDKKIDFLRILNAIWYIQSIIEETELINMFVYDKKNYKLKNEEIS